MELQYGTTAAVGDRIVTRKNQRQLTNRDGTTFVKNGDTWTVESQHRNGDLTARDSADRRVRLPREYVAAYVELGYAATTARAQGRTVDTAHVLVNETTSGEALYVSATRAREVTHLYVASEHILDLAAERPPQPATEAADILTAVLDQPTAELTATEVRQSQGHASAPAPRPATQQLPSRTPRQVRNPRRR